MTRIAKLQNKAALYRFEGLLECLDGKVLSSDEINAIKHLKEDSVIVCGRKLLCYAFAILDILGIEKYSGSNIDIKRLIIDLNFKSV